MKTNCILALLCLCSVMGFSQKLTLKKASPFTAVKWENEQPIVQFENDWYYFEKLDQFTKKELLDFCKSEFGDTWKKRFSEDLVEVLQGLNYQPDIQVTLQLSQNGVSKTVIATFTDENRQRVYAYNKQAEQAAHPQKLAVAEALADLKQFETIVESRSSYAQLSSFDYIKPLNKLATDISNKNDEVDVDEFSNKLSQIMSEIGDRHSSIKNEAFNPNAHETYNLKLPFGVTLIEGQAVAVKQNQTDDKYTYYHKSHRYLKSIDSISVEKLMDNFNYRDKKAPMPAKLSRGANAIQNYGTLLFKNNRPCPDSVQVVFSNGKTDLIETVALTTTNSSYSSKLIQIHDSINNQIEIGNFTDVYKTLDHNIGYFKIPSMYPYEDVEGLEEFIENTIKNSSNTKALIIDLRNNPGGVRAIIQTFAKYIVQPEQSPRVANVAYLRINQPIQTDKESMSSRYLYSYNSEKFTNQDRQAIDQFNKTFKPQNMFDAAKFSNPFYMLLHAGTKTYTKPVYILVNEKTFSAASVFASTFKGLPNVNIVGETTDGSSGNSRVFYLQHSNIRVKVSTMLSFQRNSKTLDGNGTVPDLGLYVDEVQVLESVDEELRELVEIVDGE